MKNFRSFKKIINVFNIYGISLTGSRKYVNLYLDLHMERVFVMGLIFELELASKKQLSDSEAKEVQTPAQIISKLIS